MKKQIEFSQSQCQCCTFGKEYMFAFNAKTLHKARLSSLLEWHLMQMLTWTIQKKTSHSEKVLRKYKRTSSNSNTSISWIELINVESTAKMPLSDSQMVESWLFPITFLTAYFHANQPSIFFDLWLKIRKWVQQHTNGWLSHFKQIIE